MQRVAAAQSQEVEVGDGFLEEVALELSLLVWEAEKHRKRAVGQGLGEGCPCGERASWVIWLTSCQGLHCWSRTTRSHGDGFHSSLYVCIQHLCNGGPLQCQALSKPVQK